jgi:hypothetical protein
MDVFSVLWEWFLWCTPFYYILVAPLQATFN